MSSNNESIVKEMASMLRQSEDSCQAVKAVSKFHPELTLDDAYAIQLNNIERKLSEGLTITGKKIGLTSLAMQNMLGVNQPDFGHLLNDMVVKNHKVVRNTMVQPKVEGEIAYVLKADLKGPNVTVEEVLAATDYVVAAIEIVDSRIENWKINIVDTVADNASSGKYVLGSVKVDPRQVDLKKVKMQLWKQDELVNEGVGADVLGDPSEAVAWLANSLHRYGVALKKGEVILSGALTAAQNAEVGDHYKVVFTELGEVSVEFTA